jgi:monoamine oxidase
VTVRVDTAVIGAGFSGLAAGLRLADSKVEFAILEARDRVGGRSVTELRGAIPVEGGGQYVGPTQPHLHAWIKRFGKRVYEAYDEGDWLLDLGAGWSRQSGTWPQMSRDEASELEQALTALDDLAGQVPVDDPWNAPHAAEWDLATLEDWSRNTVRSRRVRDFLRISTEVLLATDWSEPSLLHSLLLVRALGGVESAIWTAQAQRVEGGTHALAQAAGGELGDRVLLNSVVERIIHEGDGTVVELRGGGRVEARNAILAISPALANRISFAPALPETKAKALASMPNGDVVKSVAIYEKPFWRTEGLSGTALSVGNATSWIYDNCWSDGRDGLLVGFAFGSSSRRLRDLSPVDRREATLSDFSDAFGSRALHVTDFVDYAWQDEEFSAGCYSGYAPLGYWTGVGREMPAPVGPLFWAGTENPGAWMSTIDGAIAAGQRAADQAAASLSR